MGDQDRGEEERWIDRAIDVCTKAGLSFTKEGLSLRFMRDGYCTVHKSSAGFRPVLDEIRPGMTGMSILDRITGRDPSRVYAILEYQRVEWGATEGRGCEGGIELGALTEVLRSRTGCEFDQGRLEFHKKVDAPELAIAEVREVLTADWIPVVVETMSCVLAHVQGGTAILERWLPEMSESRA